MDFEVARRLRAREIARQSDAHCTRYSAGRRKRAYLGSRMII